MHERTKRVNFRGITDYIANPHGSQKRHASEDNWIFSRSAELAVKILRCNSKKESSCQRETIKAEIRNFTFIRSFN